MHLFACCQFTRVILNENPEQMTRLDFLEKKTPILKPYLLLFYRQLVSCKELAVMLLFLGDPNWENLISIG